MIENLISVLEDADEEPVVERFMVLPPALRAIVLEYAVQHEEGYKPALISPERPGSWKSAVKTLAPLHVSQALRKEALPLFYSNNTFCFDTEHDMSNNSAAEWIQLVGEEATRHIRHLVVLHMHWAVLDHDDCDMILLMELKDFKVTVEHDPVRSCKICRKRNEGVFKLKARVEKVSGRRAKRAAVMQRAEVRMMKAEVGVVEDDLSEVDRDDEDEDVEGVSLYTDMMEDLVMSGCDFD